MANHKTGAQRYNDRMDKIFARSKELNMKNHGKDSFGSSKPSPAHKALSKKIRVELGKKSKDNSGYRIEDHKGNVLKKGGKDF